MIDLYVNCRCIKNMLKKLSTKILVQKIDTKNTKKFKICIYELIFELELP